MARPIRNRSRLPVLLAGACLLVVACSGRDPGPLYGTWQLEGDAPIQLQFRHGESEVLQTAEAVEYEVHDDEVIVAFKSGPTRGQTLHIRMTGADTAESNIGRLKRVD